MCKFIYKVAATEILTNKELLTLLKIENVSDHCLFKLFPQKAEKIVNHSNFLKYDQLKIHAIDFLDHIYPEKLREIYNPPAVIFYRGNIELINSFNIGIVGARLGTRYSQVTIENICSRITTNKVIVSGMAKGVDTMAHVSALNNGLKTIAVMGTGIDDCYPIHNQYLKNNIENKGLVISEYPPNHITKPYNFV